MGTSALKELDFSRCDESSKTRGVGRFDVPIVGYGISDQVTNCSSGHPPEWVASFFTGDTKVLKLLSWPRCRA